MIFSGESDDSMVMGSTGVIRSAIENGEADAIGDELSRAFHLSMRQLSAIPPRSSPLFDLPDPPTDPTATAVLRETMSAAAPA